MAAEDRSTERWKPVPGWEGYYSVSDQGRVRSEERMVKSNGGRIRTAPGKILRPSLSSPYPEVGLRRNRDRTWFLIHRLVLEAFRGPCYEGMEARHLNGVADDNRLENLRWGTKEENIADMKRHGTTAKGERNPNSKLCLDDARAIAWMTRVAGASQSTLAQWFNVTASNISCIYLGKSWGYATEDIRKEAHR